jgi:hypothetical protein
MSKYDTNHQSGALLLQFSSNSCPFLLQNSNKVLFVKIFYCSLSYKIHSGGGGREGIT